MSNLWSRLELLYANRFPTEEHVGRQKLWATLVESFFSRYIPRDAVVLDVGAGFCDFINHVQARRRIAVDLNVATRKHAAPGVEVHEIEIEKLDTVIAADSVDLAFASNVFEHQRNPDALLACLGAISNVLVPGGRLLILQPNIRHVGADFWNFFDHTLPLTEQGMAEALRVAGFTVLEQRSRFLPYTTKSHLPSWDWVVRTYLQVRPLHWIFGKQMLILAEKPRV